MARGAWTGWGMSMRGTFLLGGFVLLAAAFNGCAVKAATQPAAVRIVMGDHYFQPATVRLKAGESVRIEVANEGQVSHNLMIGRELERLTWGPSEHLDKDFFAKVNLVHTENKGTFGKSRGAEITLYPGGSAELTFTVPAEKKGEWELGCLLPGHYESGMRGTLVVER